MRELEIGRSLASSIISVGKTKARVARAYVGLAILFLFLLVVASPNLRAQRQSKPTPAPSPVSTNVGPPPGARQIYRTEGISVEFNVTPASSDHGGNGELQAGSEATASFKIVDTNSGKALSNLRPAAWIDQRQGAQAPAAKECREKIQAFLQPSFAKRPTIDLNSYFILALNHEPNISVIDPLSGFGGSKLYTLVALPSSGEDWVMSADRKRLYVSMPQVNQVAVVDIASWKVVANINAGAKPTRVALQQDGRYLWIGNDGASEKESGITVIDTVALKVVAQINTGKGHHELAFNDDDSAAYVTNQQDGTLSVIDVRKLAAVANVKVGSQPASVVFSAFSKMVYVANQGDGTVVALDGAQAKIAVTLKAEPGLGEVRIPADSRFGFVLNPVRNMVYVFDLSSNRMAHAVPVGPGSDQIAFTKQFVYIRSTGSEFVTMLKIADLGKEAAISRFPAGQKAPRESPASSLASAIVPAPEEGSVLVANPADETIYYYTEGMAAPMGSFQNYKREPKALLVLDNSLRETAPGVYTITLRLAASGRYDVPFLLDSPRVVNCFEFAVGENSAAAKSDNVAIKIEPLITERTARVGQPYKLRFRVVDSVSHEKLQLDDMQTLVFLAPGIWQQRDGLTALGDGVYEINFVPPEPGVYYVFFQCLSLGVRFAQLTPITLEALKT
jgi:YVTN family beta-propeller protein